MGEGRGTATDFAELAETILRALDASAIGMSITATIDGELSRLYLNEAGARMLGYTRDEIDRIPPMIVVAEEHQQRMKEIYRRWLDGEPQPPNVEVDLLRRDGSRLPVEVGLASSEYQGAPATVAFIHDISDRRQMEEALRSSEARFRELAEGAPDVITVVSEGRFVYANPAAARSLGYESVEELLAHPLSDWLPEDEMRRMGERMARVLAGERLPPAEYVGRHVDGRDVTLEISSVRTERDGKPAVLAFGRDVSERKRLHEELMRADRMATVGTLAAGVAHEINNPLTYVLFNLQRVRRDLASGSANDAEVREMLDVALEGAERVRVIVQDLLAFTRPDSTEIGAVDVTACVRSALKLAEHSLRHRARVETSFEAVPPALGVAARLGQVFLNLLVNAAQAFDTDSTGENVVRVTVRRTDDEVRVEISDNGRGMPAERVERVFDPFFTTKPAGTGTGLGLTISRSIVESFGGRMSLDSAPGEGTTVTVSLRSAPRRAATRTNATRPSERPPPGRSTLLIVDDEPLVGRALERLLREDHSVSLHTDPRDALHALLEGPAPDAILCDIVMPHLSGPDLYERVRNDRPDLARRFVFVTGGPFTPRASEFVATTEQPIVRKPIDLDDLLEALAKVVSATRRDG